MSYTINLEGGRTYQGSPEELLTALRESSREDSGGTNEEFMRSAGRRARLWNNARINDTSALAFLQSLAASGQIELKENNE